MDLCGFRCVPLLIRDLYQGPVFLGARSYLGHYLYQFKFLFFFFFFFFFLDDFFLSFFFFWMIFFYRFFFTWMVFECLLNCNDNKLALWLDIAERKGNRCCCHSTAVFSVSRAANFTRFVTAIKHAAPLNFILCARSECLVMLLTPNFHWICVRCVTAPIRFCSAAHRPATTTSYVLSPPRRSTIDSWRRQAEEFLR